MAEHLTQPEKNSLEAGQLSAWKEVQTYDAAQGSFRIEGVPLELGV